MKLFTKIRALLTPVERRGAGFLLAWMVVGMVLETFGIGLIIPTMSIMMQGDLISRYPKIASLLIIAIGEPTQPKLVAAAMIGLVGVYFVKNVFLAFLAWKQTKFSYEVQAKLSLAEKLGAISGKCDRRSEHFYSSYCKRLDAHNRTHGACQYRRSALVCGAIGGTGSVCGAWRGGLVFPPNDA
jgi:hypothetical protein